MATLVEDRFRAAGRTAVRLAVLDGNPDALAFWTALGYEVVAEGRDRQLDRPCTVLRKPLTTPPPSSAPGAHGDGDGDGDGA